MSYGNCLEKNKTIASFTTNANNPETASWDLTPFKTVGMGPPGGTWRIIEVGYNLQYQSGVIAADGTLAPAGYVAPEAGTPGASEPTPSGLPDSFNSHYSYDGYMEIQVDPPPKKCPKAGEEE